MFPPSTRSSVPCVLSPRAHGPGPEAPLVAPHARPGGTTTAKVPDAGARGIPHGSRASLGMRVQRGASQGDHLCVPTAAWQVWAHVCVPCPGDHKQLSSLSVRHGGSWSGGGGGMYGNVSDLGCLVLQNPCQGLASPERQRLARSPRPALVSSPADACLRRDLDACSGRTLCSDLSIFCFLISSSTRAQPLGYRNLQRPVPECLCPSPQWHRPGRQMTGGHAAGDRASRPDGVELPGRGPQPGRRSRRSADCVWTPACWSPPARGGGDFPVNSFQPFNTQEIKSKHTGRHNCGL